MNNLLALRLFVRCGVAALLLVIVLAAAGSAPSASGHTLTFLSPVSSSVCLSAGNATARVIYSGAGPSDRTWVANVTIGGSIGNPFPHQQESKFRFSLSSSAGEAAAYAVPVDYWIAGAGAHAFGSSLTAHLGGTMSLSLWVENSGSSSHCFQYSGWAGYR